MALRNDNFSVVRAGAMRILVPRYASTNHDPKSPWNAPYYPILLTPKNWDGLSYLYNNMKFEVEAPTDLPAGYPLEVDINGKPVTFSVPYNVKAGVIIPCKLSSLKIITSVASTAFLAHSFAFIQSTMMIPHPAKLPFHFRRQKSILRKTIWHHSDDGEMRPAIVAVSSVYRSCGGLRIVCLVLFGGSFWPVWNSILARNPCRPIGQQNVQHRRWPLHLFLAHVNHPVCHCFHQNRLQWRYVRRFWLHLFR